jgi:hypothetical protein
MEKASYLQCETVGFRKYAFGSTIEPTVNLPSIITVGITKTIIMLQTGCLGQPQKSSYAVEVKFDFGL